MRICHVITRLIIGGAQENTLLTCEGLHDRGHHLLLLAGPDTGPEGSLWDRANSYAYHTKLIPSMHRAVRPLKELHALRELRRAYAEFKPDIIHTHSSKAGILGRLAAKSLPHCKIVHTIHGMSFNRTQPAIIREFYRLLERRAAKFTHKLVCVADAMIEQSLAGARTAGWTGCAGGWTRFAGGIAPRDKFITVYSGVQTEWFTPDPQKRQAARRCWGLADSHIVVGAVARLFRNKGYEQLIPALAKAAAQNDRLRFVWIGDGDHRGRYLDELARLGISDRVTLTGLLPPKQVADHMQGFDMLVHCSQWEGLPRTVVQALLLEIPAISFDIDGAPEVVIDRHTGRLLRLNDVALLSDAILQLAADPQTRAAMGRTGRQRCLNMFDHRRMVDHLERLYTELLNTPQT